MSTATYTQGQPVTVTWKGRQVNGYVDSTFTWNGQDRVAVWIPNSTPNRPRPTIGERLENFDLATVVAR